MENVNLDSVQRELFEYWKIRCGNTLLPGRKHIHPEDMPGLLKHVGLIDVARRGAHLRFRYRLVGTQMNFMFGEDYSGRWLHEAKTGSYMDYLHDLYAEAVNTRKPVFSASKFAYLGERHLKVKRLILPLASDGQEVDMLLFCNLFASDDHSFGFRPYPASEIIAFREELRHAA